jgi:fructose-bisphosphate aldolase, class II
MPLRPINELIRHAREHRYALGYFESWNLESLQGVLDAAEETRSPTIIGFNGGFLSHRKRKYVERLRCYSALGRAGAESCTVPCGLIFNECPDDQWTREAVLAGFNLVMPADTDAPHEEYLRRVKVLTEFAHRHGVAVESEVDQLPTGASGSVDGTGRLTDPDLAAHFASETVIDLLGVSVGNVHVLLKGELDLDLQLLSRIAQRVSKPLVLHGGTGISAESMREAIRLGVVKINYGTYLKQRYLKAVRAALSVDMLDPHELLGFGGDHDVMIAGRVAVREAVLERIENLGCCGKGR